VLEVFDAPREIPFHAHEELADHIEEFLRTVGWSAEPSGSPSSPSGCD